MSGEQHEVGADTVAERVEEILRKWERARLEPEGASVRRGMALEIRLALKRLRSAR